MSLETFVQFLQVQHVAYSCCAVLLYSYNVCISYIWIKQIFCPSYKSCVYPPNKCAFYKPIANSILLSLPVLRRGVVPSGWLPWWISLDSLSPGVEENARGERGSWRREDIHTLDFFHATYSVLLKHRDSYSILTTRSMELSAGSSLGVEQRLDQSVTRVERTWCDYKERGSKAVVHLCHGTIKLTHAPSSKVLCHSTRSIPVASLQ